MAKAAVAKLLLLVILIFIICLPEFFRIYSVSQVNFLCIPYHPGEQRNQDQKGEPGRPGKYKNEIKGVSNLPSTPKHKQWEEICGQETQRNTTDLRAETQKVGGDAGGGWFMCETDRNMEELRSNSSSTALVVLLEVSASFQLNDTGSVNLTFYGHNNHSSLYLRAPEEEEDQTGDDADHREAFYCCLPLIPTPKSANQSRCVLWLANQTLLTGTETEPLPWKRAEKGEWCRFRVTWLLLLSVVFLIVLIAVVGKIYAGKRLNLKPVAHPIDYHSANQQEKGKAYRLIQLQSWSGLSPIPEIDSQDDDETLLDVDPFDYYKENSSSLLPSSCPLPHRRTGVLTEAQQKECRNSLKAH